MRRGQRLPDDQAGIVFSDAFVEQVGTFTPDERIDVIAAMVALCHDPSGRHPLHAPLQGWNTEDVLEAAHRVVYRAGTVDDVGVIDVLCLGPRSGSQVYDMATALASSGLLTDDEVTFLWDALAVLDVVEEDVGLDGWDFRPPADVEVVIAKRRDDRCGVLMPRAQAPCIRRAGHPGPHRATP